MGFRFQNHGNWLEGKLTGQWERLRGWAAEHESSLRTHRQNRESGTITRTATDTTLPTGPIERTLEYHVPFTLSNRETECATVWTKLDATSRSPSSP